LEKATTSPASFRIAVTTPSAGNWRPSFRTWIRLSSERPLELLRRTFPGDVVRRKDRREWQADEFLGLIAKHQFHTGIPRDDRAGPIDHEHGIVGEALDEQTKTLLDMLFVGRGNLRRIHGSGTDHDGVCAPGMPRVSNVDTSGPLLEQRVLLR
jgi:hypothetical protein